MFEKKIHCLTVSIENWLIKTPHKSISAPNKAVPSVKSSFSATNKNFDSLLSYFEFKKVSNGIR